MTFLARALLIASVAVSFGICSRAADASASEDPLAHLRASHPRLLFTDDDLAKAVAAAKTDPLRAALQQHILATAEFILTAPPVHQPDHQSKSFLEQDRYAVYYMVTCAMAYRLSGDERFLARAKSDLLNIATFPDWDPKHFLSVAEMSFAEAIGYDWLYAKLKPEERAAIKQALLKKSLCAVDGTYGYVDRSKVKPDWSGKSTGNWNQVCNSGLVSAALALADEEPELARKVIAGARESMPIGMAAYAPDGGFPEGPGYWTYATTYAAIAFSEMESALGTDFGLASSSGFEHTMDYYEAVEGPFGPVFNYADATDDLQNSPVRAWLAKRFQEPFALRHSRSLLADTLQREPIAKFDRAIQGTVINRVFALHEVWFPDEPAGSVANPPLDFHFRGDADIATFRSAWNDTNAVFVGFKAGANTANHGHLDLGSFVLDADGQRWAMDFGPDAYALPGYFDVKTARRSSYFRINNHGHNTVTPGDALQIWHIVAPITSFGSTPERAFAVANLTPAYPDEANSLRRGIALLDRARVLVQDEYLPKSPGTPLHWTMITKAKIEVARDSHSATLTSNGRTLRVDLLWPASARLQVGSTRPPIAAENQNEGTSALTIDLTPNSDGGATRLAVLLTPMGDKWPHLSPPELRPLEEWSSAAMSSRGGAKTALVSN